MTTKIGLATAIVASVASGGAMAQRIGEVSGFFATPNPKLIITNTSATAYSGVKLLAFNGVTKIGSTSIGVLPAAVAVSSSGFASFLLGNGGGSATRLMSKPGVPGLTSSDTFQLVAAGLQSAVFGDTPDWLGKTNTKATNGAQALAALFAVPEPATILLMTAGIAGVAASRRRRG